MHLLQAAAVVVAAFAAAAAAVCVGAGALSSHGLHGLQAVGWQPLAAGAVGMVRSGVAEAEGA